MNNKKQRSIYDLKHIAVEFARLFVKDFEILYVENAGGYTDYIRFDGYYFMFYKTIKQKENGTHGFPDIFPTISRELKFEFRKYEFKDGVVNLDKMEIIENYNKNKVVSILKKYNFI